MDPVALALAAASCAGAGALFADLLEVALPGGSVAIDDDSDSHKVSTRPAESGDVRHPDHPVPPVLVRLLGPVAVELDGRSLTIPRVVELVAYLVTHRDGVSDERIKAALWPERAPCGATFNNLVSLARRQLGEASDGSLHIPHAERRRYRVGRSVASDWEQLTAATKAATRTASPASIDELERVVLDVRGIPFEATRGFEWTHEEGLAAAAAADIRRAVKLIVRLLSKNGHVERAEQALRSALRPCHGNWRDENAVAELVSPRGHS